MFKFSRMNLILALASCAYIFLRAGEVQALWETSAYGDAFDDHQRIFAVTANPNGTSLYLKCDKYMGAVNLAFDVDEYINSGEEIDVRMRFDREDIITTTGWAKNRVFFVLDQRQLRKLLPRMRKYRSLAIEVYDYDFGRIVATYDLEGYTSAEQKVRSTCIFPAD